MLAIVVDRSADPTAFYSLPYIALTNVIGIAVAINGMFRSAERSTTIRRSDRHALLGICKIRTDFISQLICMV